MVENVVSSGRQWADKVISLYKEGCSDAEVAAELGVTLKAYYKQINDNAAFAQLVEFGRTLCQSFWESQFRKNINNKQFNTSLLTFYMKNKYGWADKTEVSDSSDSSTKDLDAVRQELEAQVARFIKARTPEITDAKRLLIPVESIG